MSISGSNPDLLRDKVRDAYSAAAERPKEKHAFPVGRQFAESIGYSAELLDSLPPVARDAFAGVSNVSMFAELPVGATVLDLGCGSGTDTLIAARRVGLTGKVIAVDFSAAMLSRTRRVASESGATNVELRESDAERLPIADGEIDVGIVNGIFNLNPARDAIFRELARVSNASSLLAGNRIPPGGNPIGNSHMREYILLSCLGPSKTRSNDGEHILHAEFKSWWVHLARLRRAHHLVARAIFQAVLLHLLLLD